MTPRTVQAGVLALAVVALAAPAGAGQIEQTVTLSSGWNAVYVNVAPDASADEVFADWPVWSVSAYNARSFLYTASTAGGKTGESVANAPYWIWSREAPQASSLKSLSADTVLLCYSTNSSPFSATLRGVPAAPRIAWHATGKEARSGLNPVGMRLGGRVKLSDWLAGGPAEPGGTIYRIAGTDDSMPTYIPAAGFGNKPVYIEDGDVVFVPSLSISDWAGPLHVMPRAGVDFGEDGTVETVSVRNDGAANKTVTISYIDSADGIARPDLLFRDSSHESDEAGWLPLTNALTRVVATGETWSVSVALDRSKLGDTGANIGGVIAITEEGGTMARVWLPVSAKDSKTANPWPQGIWEAKLSLTKVSCYVSDSNRIDGVPAGGVMPVKVYLKVGPDGTAKLAQRVLVSGVRLSSAALPVDVPEIPAKGGVFGASDSPLSFEYSIAATSPSNPFRHALHPLFDNKQMDFKTPAPDGDDVSNYVGTVKPELFSIGGAVELSFSENAATAWTPMETLVGTCKWSYTGVRRDGPVVAEGAFVARRVTKELPTE